MAPRRAVRSGPGGGEGAVRVARDPVRPGPHPGLGELDRAFDTTVASLDRLEQPPRGVMAGLASEHRLEPQDDLVAVVDIPIGFENADPLFQQHRVGGALREPHVEVLDGVGDGS